MNVENQNVYITLKFIKKHNNQRLIYATSTFSFAAIAFSFPAAL